MRGIKLIVVVLLLTLLSSSGFVVPLPMTQAQSSTSEKVLRKICFIRDGELWLIDEDGGNSWKVVEKKEPLMGAQGCVWSPDGRYIAYEILDRREVSLTTVAMDVNGEKTPSLQGMFWGWDADSRFMVVSSSYDRLGWPVGTEYRTFNPRPARSAFEILEKAFATDKVIFYSPQGNYRVALSEPPESELIEERMFIYRTNLDLEDSQGNFITTISKRSLPQYPWFYQDDKIAFWEISAETEEEVLSIYSLPNTLLRRFSNAWFGVVLYLQYGRQVLYLDKDTGPKIVDLISGQEEKPKLQDYFWTEGIHWNSVRLAEAGTKLVFSTLSFDRPKAVLSNGIFVYDFETMQINQIADVPALIFDVAGDLVVYEFGGSLYAVSLNEGESKLLFQGGLITQIAIQPRTPPERLDKRKVLVLVQGIGSEVKEGHPRNVFPELWPIFDEALARGLYQDVLVYSYNGGRFENGKWTPILGFPEGSYKSIKESANTLSFILSEYATLNPGVTYDLLGHSLGGKVAWEYLKAYIIGKNHPRSSFSIGRLITLGSPLNGRHRDGFFQTIGQLVDELVRSKAADELQNEAFLAPHQIVTEDANIKSYALAAGDEILIFNMASEDDCIVPQQGLYPYNSALINGFGYLYKGLGRGVDGIRFADCAITNYNLLDPSKIVQVDLADAINVVALIQVKRKPDEKETETLIKAGGHERYFWHPRVWMDLKDLILYNQKPKRLENN